MARTKIISSELREDSDGSNEQKYNTKDAVPCKLYALILKGLEYQAKSVKARANGKNDETVKKLEDVANKYWERCIRRVQKKASCQGDPDVKEVDYRDEVGRTLLHILCEENAPAAVVEKILEANPDNCRVIVPYDMQSPLHKATGTKDKRGASEEFFARKEKLVRLLMEAYPPAILMKEEEGETTPLHFLLEWTKNKNLVKRMVDLANQERSPTNILQIKDKEDQLPLHIAVDYESSTDVITYLLTQYKDGLKQQTVHGATCLHLAVLRKRTELIKCFSKHYPEALMTKVDENYENNGGTPLHFLFKTHPHLTRDQHERILRYMLEPFSKNYSNRIKSVVNKMDSKNKSVIEIARTMKVHRSIRKLLEDLQKGKFPDWESSGGRAQKKRQRLKKNHRPCSRSRSNDEIIHPVKKEPEERLPKPTAVAPSPLDDIQFDFDKSPSYDPQASDMQMDIFNEVQPPVAQMHAVHLSAQNQQDSIRNDDMSLAAASLSSYLTQNLPQKNIAVKQE